MALLQTLQVSGPHPVSVLAPPSCPDRAWLWLGCLMNGDEGDGVRELEAVGSRAEWWKFTISSANVNGLEVFILQNRRWTCWLQLNQSCFSKPVPARWFRLKVRSAVKHLTTVVTFWHRLAHPLLGCSLEVGLPSDRLTRVSGLTCFLERARWVWGLDAAWSFLCRTERWSGMTGIRAPERRWEGGMEAWRIRGMLAVCLHIVQHVKTQASRAHKKALFESM